MTSKLSCAIKDVSTGFMKWELWLNFAWEDIKTTYGRTIIGIGWVTLSYLMFVGTKIFIFVPIVDRGEDSLHYSLYIAVGFTSWLFISNVILGATNVFISSGNWMKNDPIPISVFAYQLVTRAFFNFSLTLIALAIILVALAPPVDFTLIWSLLALPLYLVTAFSLSIVVGLLSARFRDVKHLIDASVRAMLFLSPVFWTPEMMGNAYEKYLKWNPINYYIDIFRAPILNQTVNFDSWLAAGSVTAILFFAAIFSISISKSRLIFWI